MKKRVRHISFSQNTNIDIIVGFLNGTRKGLKVNMELDLFNSKKNSMNMTVLPFIDADCFHVKCNSLVSTNSSDLSRWLSLLLFASVRVSCTTDFSISLSLLFPNTTLTDAIPLRVYPRACNVTFCVQ